MNDFEVFFSETQLTEGCPVDLRPQFNSDGTTIVFERRTPTGSSYGDGVGTDMARRYLIQNIRVEQKHAEHWVAWAGAAGLSLNDLRSADDAEELHALAHWCWYVCDRADLAVAMAATNYAVEGATGDWACVVCSKDTYAKSLPDEIRAPAMRWLKVHAEYDDTHPWEALDIIATLLRHAPSTHEIAHVQQAVRSSYRYMELSLDSAMLASIMTRSTKQLPIRRCWVDSIPSTSLDGPRVVQVVSDGTGECLQACLRIFRRPRMVNPGD